MAAKLTRLTHKIAIQVRLVAESCTIRSSSLQAASAETWIYRRVTLASWYGVCLITVRLVKNPNILRECVHRNPLLDTIASHFSSSCPYTLFL